MDKYVVSPNRHEEKFGDYMKRIYNRPESVEVNRVAKYLL
jgi:hypothetical protein